MNKCTHKTVKGKRCAKNVWQDSPLFCYVHDPRTVSKAGRPRKPVAAPPSKEVHGAAPMSLHGAKMRVSKLLSRAEATGMRPRDQAELLRVLASLSELEQKQSVEGIDGLIVVDMGPGQHVVVADD